MSVVNDKRKHERIDIYAVIEFRPQQNGNDTYFGITRNFSREGFSFESQDFDLDVGDRLKFILRHPRSDVSVSDTGEIVWKEKNSKFDCVTGVIFTGDDPGNRRKVLEAASSVEGMSYHAFFPDGELPDDDESPSPEDGGTETVPRGSTLEAVHDNAEEVPPDEPPLEYDDTSPPPFEPAVEPASSEHIENKRWHRHGTKLPYARTAIGAALVLAVAAAFISGIFSGGEKGPGQPAGNPPRQETSDSSSFKSGGPSEAIKGEYIIQVGAWKHPDYAQKTLNNLKKFYPDAYIVEQNGFYKVRIAGFTSRSQGTDAATDIEDRLDLRPVLLSPRGDGR